MADAVGSLEQTNYLPQDATNLRNATNQLGGMVGGLQNQATTAANNYQTNYQQYATPLNSNFGQYQPNLNTNFQGPNFSNQLDGFSRNMISQGADASQQRLGSQQNQIQQQYGAKNGALAGILNSLAGTNSQLGQNPMAFQAAAAQRAREGQEFQLNQQSQALGNAGQLAQGQEGSRLQALGNATNLQQSQNNSNLQGMQNSAIGQQLQISSLPAQMQQGLTGILAQIAQMFGQKQSTPQAGGHTAPGSLWNPDAPLAPFPRQ